METGLCSEESRLFCWVRKWRPYLNDCSMLSFAYNYTHSSGMNKPDSNDKRNFARVYIEYREQRIQAKFLLNTKILALEEFIKRKVKMGPIESIYLFVRENRRLMNPARLIQDYAREPNQAEKEDNPNNEPVLRIVVRKTDTF